MIPKVAAMAACWEWEECLLSTPSQNEASDAEEMCLILRSFPGAEGEESGFFMLLLGHG